MKKNHRIVTIDGPAGAGKSTVARRVAELLNFSYLDTGAMYRAVALKANQKQIGIDDTEALAQMLCDTEISFSPEGRIFLDSQDVSEFVRTSEISSLASKIAEVVPVREFLVNVQRKIGERGGLVVEGRDMGTHVFPWAVHKFYLDASILERAKRRLLQRGSVVNEKDLLEVEAEIIRRDRRDTLREYHPLCPAADAKIIDTTGIPAEQVARTIAFLAEDLCSEKTE